MKRIHISYLVDWVLLITLLLTVWSGFSMTSFSFHKRISILFTIFTGVHLLSHRELIVEKTKKILFGHHMDS